MSAESDTWESARGWERPTWEKPVALASLDDQVSSIRDTIERERKRYDALKATLAEQKADHAREKQRLEKTAADLVTARAELDAKLKDEEARHADTRSLLKTATRDHDLSVAAFQKSHSSEVATLRAELKDALAWHVNAREALKDRTAAIAQRDAALKASGEAIARLEADLRALRAQPPREVVKLQQVPRKAPVAIDFDFERDARGRLEGATAIARSEDRTLVYRFKFARDPSGRIIEADAKVEAHRDEVLAA